MKYHIVRESMVLFEWKSWRVVVLDFTNIFGQFRPSFVDRDIWAMLRAWFRRNTSLEYSNWRTFRGGFCVHKVVSLSEWKNSVVQKVDWHTILGLPRREAKSHWINCCVKRYEYRWRTACHRPWASKVAMLVILVTLDACSTADPALPHTDIPKKGNHDKSESCAGLVWVESLPGGMYSSNDLLVSTALQCSGCVL